jgi:hypothetical protein
MHRKTDDLRQALIFQPILLSFESQREYRQLADAIRDHISPRDILEEMWTSEIVARPEDDSDDLCKSRSRKNLSDL